jgi:hypothetical protein
VQFDVPDRISLAVPDAARVARIREDFTKSAAPVRPLPSNGWMMALCVVVFAVLAVLLTVPFGFGGFAKLNAASAAIEYSVVGLLALVLAGAAIEGMIPGSRRTLPPSAGVLIAILLLSVTAALLFPDFALHDFVHRGIPCLRLGILCAIPASGLIWAMMRRGFVMDTVSAVVAGGALSGLLGVGVLALHCPILNAAHIIAWHIGVIAVTAVFGALLGWIVARYR